MEDTLTFAEKIVAIKTWLGTGSINIFGLPMSGKDTVGVRLAEEIGGKFLSSGLIIRAMEKANSQHLSSSGALIPTDIFYDWVLPYFEKDELKDFPLILSSIGRWSGEETQVIETAKNSGHTIKAAVILNISEADVEKRWQTVQTSAAASLERGVRADDKSLGIFQKRIEEFREKTRPVLLSYRDLGLLVEVRADNDRETVFRELIERLYDFSLTAKKRDF